MSQAEFARQVGVSQPAVSKAIRTGRLNGKAVAGSKVVLPYALDQWKGNADTRGGDQASRENNESPQLREYKTRAAKADAERKELELAEKRGRLRDIHEIADVATLLFRELGQMTEQLPAMTDDIMGIAQKGDATALRQFLKDHARQMREHAAARLEALADTDREEAA